MGSYSSTISHRSMIFDHKRNDAYTSALKKLITPETVVLDLGAGLGIHGLVAAQLGAKKVVMIDPSPVINTAKSVAKVNGFSDRIHCIQKSVAQISLLEKFDIIISTFTGNFLLSEDLLPVLFDARDRFLRPGGRLLPDRGEMEIASVSMPEYYSKHISCWNHFPQGVDFGEIKNLAVNNLYYDSAESFSAALLSNPAQLMELDFMTSTEAACRSSVSVKINHNGLCHGWMGWFKSDWEKTGYQLHLRPSNCIGNRFFYLWKNLSRLITETSLTLNCFVLNPVNGHGQPFLKVNVSGIRHFCQSLCFLKIC